MSAQRAKARRSPGSRGPGTTWASREEGGAGSRAQGGRKAREHEPLPPQSPGATDSELSVCKNLRPRCSGNNTNNSGAKEALGSQEGNLPLEGKTLEDIPALVCLHVCGGMRQEGASWGVQDTGPFCRDPSSSPTCFTRPFVQESLRPGRWTPQSLRAFPVAALGERAVCSVAHGTDWDGISAKKVSNYCD